jgi:hypothetical protein
MWPILVFLVFGVCQDAKADPKVEEVIEAVRVTAVVVPKGKMARLPIRTNVIKIVVSDEKVLRVSPFESSNSVFLEGLTAGITRLTLTDENKGEEKLIVIVETPTSGPQKAGSK